MVSPMSRLLVVGGLLVLCVASAKADPLVRFGMTFGIDRNVPEAHEFGPMIALGGNLGRFSGEANYSYLSFFDDDTRIHRAGVALRMDIVRSFDLHHGSKALYGELGAAQRMGHWRVNDVVDPAYKTQPELQVAAGYELSGNGGAWQLALRFGFSKRDPMLGVACRGITCPVAMPASTGVAESVMLEWTWLLFRGY
jgi:hypothetical protein